ncbi:hypothetical protein PV04_07260 [Phialophora macrospora]|uniref:Major facilitator superfamily (MFS) profile domain-containing protein n=1 Tax=Phialophora macrospora TaxID=1851006 RepID=A0A0D2CIF0_9EURO|nr:hypothetical protein PV04_07260 [Phialophora macrospora]
MGLQIQGKLISGYNLLIIAFATFGSITYGYCGGILVAAFGTPSFITYFGLDTDSNAAAITGALNGLFQAGGFFGALGTGIVSDKLGRCKGMFLASVVCVAGGALQAGSVHVAMYLVARFITGYGIGGLVMVVPLWQSEVAPPHARGLLVGLHGVSIMIGYSLSSWVGYGFYFVSDPVVSWRVPLALQCIPPLVLALGVYVIPESPRWLVENGQEERAKATLEKIYHNSGDPENTVADDEFGLIVSQLALERALPSSWASIFSLPHYRKRALIGFGVLLAGQLTGTIVVGYYQASYYTGLGFSGATSLMFSGFYMLIGMVGNGINAYLLDRVGRKWLMIAGLTGCIIALVGISVIQALFQGTTNRGGNIAGVFFLYLHIAIYASTIDATTYVYASEIWPTHLRAKGLGISCSGLFLGSLVLSVAAPTAFAHIAWRFYVILGSTCVVAIACFVRFLAETKGLPLEEIAAQFGDQVVTNTVGIAEEASSTSDRLDLTEKKGPDATTQG